MNSKTIILFAIVGFLLESVVAFNCSSVVKIQSKGVLNYLATATFPALQNVDGSSWELQMETDVPFTFIGGWNVWVQSEPELGKAVFKSRASNLTISQNDPVTFSFRISWSTRNEPVPEVISLIWEGSQVCKSSRRHQTSTSSPPQPQGRRSRVNVHRSH